MASIGSNVTQQVGNVDSFDSGLRKSAGGRTDAGDGVVRSKVGSGSGTVLSGRTVSGRVPMPVPTQVAMLSEVDNLLAGRALPSPGDLQKAHDLLDKVMHAKGEDGKLLEPTAAEPREDTRKGVAIAANRLGSFYLRFEVEGKDSEVLDRSELARHCFQFAVAAGDDDAGNGSYHMGKYWLALLENALRGGSAMSARRVVCADACSEAVSSFAMCSARRLQSGLEANPGAQIGIAYALCVDQLKDLPTREELVGKLKEVEDWGDGDVPGKYGYHLGKFAEEGFLRMCDSGAPQQSDFRSVDVQAAEDLQNYIDKGGVSADPGRLARAYNVLGSVEDRKGNVLKAIQNFLKGLSSAPQKIFRRLYEFFSSADANISGAVSVLSGPLAGIGSGEALRDAGEVVQVDAAATEVVISSKSVKLLEDDSSHSCKSELEYRWHTDGQPLVARSEARVPKFLTDSALTENLAIRTAMDNPVPTVAESYAAYCVLKDAHAQLKALHPKSSEEQLLEKAMKRPALAPNSGWDGTVGGATSGPTHIVRFLHDGLGAKEFDEMSAANDEAKGGTIFSQVCPELNSIFYNAGEKKGLLLPMTVNPGTFSHNGWYSAMNGQDENRHQMPNNMAWQSEYHKDALPEVEVAHKLNLEKYGIGGRDVRTADSRRLVNQEIPDDSRVVLTADMHRVMRGKELAFETLEGWPELMYESECRGVTGFDTGNALNNDMRVEQTVSAKMGANPRVKILNAIHKTAVLMPPTVSKGGGLPIRFEQFATKGSPITDAKLDDFNRRIHTDGLLASDRSRTRARNEVLMDLVQTAEGAGKQSYTVCTEDTFDHVGHHIFTQGGHSVRSPHQMSYMGLLDKIAAQAESELPKNTLMIRHSDHSGDVYGGYAHYHADQSAHGQRTTFTQRTGFMSLNYTGKGAKQITQDSVLQMPAVYDLPIIESSASNKKIELVGDERMTLAGELAVDLSEGLQLSKDVDYIYSPNYVPKSGQELLYKFYVKTTRTPTVNYVMEPGQPDAFKASDRGKAALEGGERYIQDMKQTRSYQLLTEEKANLREAKLGMLGYIVSNRTSFPDFQDSDIGFLHDLAQVDGLSDYRGMHDLGWRTGGIEDLDDDSRSVYEKAIIQRLKGLMDSTGDVALTVGFNASSGDCKAALDAFMGTQYAGLQKEISPHQIANGNLPKAGAEQHPMFRSQKNTALQWGQDHRPNDLKLGTDRVDAFRSTEKFPAPKVSALPGLLVRDGILTGGNSQQIKQLVNEVNDQLEQFGAREGDVKDVDRTEGFTQIRNTFIQNFVGIDMSAYAPGTTGREEYMKGLLKQTQYVRPDEEADAALLARFGEYLNTEAFRAEVASASFQAIVRNRVSLQLASSTTTAQ